MAAAILFMTIGSCQAVPFVTKTDKGVDVDVWPFFRMHLAREPRGMVLDIEVLSGMVKVNYDRKPGEKPNINVSVFGIGGSGGGGTKTTTIPIDDIESELGELKAASESKNNRLH
ncbi:hypothetical protein BLA29_007785 [Euroglyphus maynei]|uniref:Uncharacterized protein n=1 Tax=Euroglyphus maynei TaxID=6958 RepID=A0A1Y3BSZ9_EURMA|nr:hypothetical protein BLA29_007785 [Euroglyphus maynei]